MADWMCMIGGARRGPFPDEQLRAMARDGQIAPTDLVWNPAAKQWEQAVRLDGLFPVPQDTSAALAVARADAGPFFHVADAFSIGGGGKWGGAVVASPAAIYLLKRAADFPYNGGGGGAFETLIARAESNWDDVRSCRLVELPDLQRRQLDRHGNDGALDVIIFPRAAVSLARVGAVTLDVHCGPHTVGVVVGIFQSRAVREFLERAGWALDREVKPTALPVHGAGYGRGAAEPKPRRRGRFARGAYAAAAILSIVTVATVREYLRPRESAEHRRARLTDPRQQAVPGASPIVAPHRNDPLP